MTDVSELLLRFWGVRADRVNPLAGGMNSETWLVEHQGRSFVAKQVASEEVDELVAGCEVASALASAGFVTGRPIPTVDGRLVVTEHRLALLEYISGRELEGAADEEQVWIATTLAGVHAASGTSRGGSGATFARDWLAPPPECVEAHAWLGAAIEAVRAETDALTLTWAMLHTDPAAEAFIHDDRTGTTALIDWAGARRGPILYDVASAVMYLGGPDHASTFLTTYRRIGPLGSDELQALDSFRRFRWAVQAVYFAQRLSSQELTGISGNEENQMGLDDARRALTQLGLATA